MSRAALTLSVALALAATLSVARAGEPPEADLAGVIRERLDVAARADAASWSSHVDDNCLCNGETKADIVRAILNRPPGVSVAYGAMADFESHAFGNVMTARYRVTETVAIDGEQATSEQWRIETYFRRGERWMLIAGAESLIAPDPVPVSVASERLAAYAGRYEYTPGSVDTISVEGDRLYVQPTGEPRVEIYAEDPQTFFAKGQAWRIVFRPDALGTVTSLVFRVQGQEYPARRLP